MNILAIDVGSSSVKAGLFGREKSAHVVRVATASTVRGVQVELSAAVMLKAVFSAIQQAAAGRKVDAIALDTLSPGVVVFDGHGKPLVGCITHQDRRSVPQAQEIERRVGKARHLKLAGNRPFPGGIGSTSLLWIKENLPGVWKKVAMVGQPSTLLIHALTGRWVIDPSQAAFLGLNDFAEPTQWSPELCEVAGLKADQLPRMEWADEVAGMLSPPAARRLGLRSGIPILGGLVDTGAALLGTPLRAGQLLHNAGSTDVLALCVTHPKPAENVLTRPIGAGRSYPKMWLAVSTIAASGSALNWVRKTCFSEMADKAWYGLVERQCKKLTDDGVRFTPYLAGDRTALEQLHATIGGLTLGTSREDILGAALRGLVRGSAERVTTLKSLYRINHHVLTMGGDVALGAAMHRAWPGKGRRFTPVKGEALEGLVEMTKRVLQS